jgi:hypothetical protein
MNDAMTKVLNETQDRLENKSIWSSDDTFWWLKTLATTKKGAVGEQFIIDFFGDDFYIVKKSSKDYDLLFDNMKTEVKLSCLGDVTGLFKFGQVKPYYVHDYFFFIGVYPNEVKCWFFSNTEIKYFFENGSIPEMYDGAFNEESREGMLIIDTSQIQDWVEEREIKSVDDLAKRIEYVGENDDGIKEKIKKIKEEQDAFLGLFE